MLGIQHAPFADQAGDPVAACALQLMLHHAAGVSWGPALPEGFPLGYVTYFTVGAAILHV